ncbi:MAG: VanZ family protein [Bacilli bacterium]|nr:VanZ family protein [Bacilli bacterium]
MVYNLFKSSLINMWPSLVIIAVTLTALRVAYLKNHRDTFCFHEEFWTLVSILYMLLLYQMVTRVDINASSGINIVPFQEILRYKFDSELFIFNVIGNIALFVPFGYIIGTYVKPKKIWTNLVVALVVSGTIEFVQLNIGRSFDIDDIILNTVGCIIGFLIYVGFRAVGRHLPNFLKSDWFNNLICIIIVACIGIYVLNIMGIGF